MALMHCCWKESLTLLHRRFKKASGDFSLHKSDSPREKLFKRGAFLSIIGLTH